MLKTSKALENLNIRLRDIDQLLQAHTVLTLFRRIQRTTKEAGRGLGKITEMVNDLVENPGPGRRSEVEAINRAGIVLLSAHLQGFIEEIYEETAYRLLMDRVLDLQPLIDQAISSFSNPRPFRINKLFTTIGISKIMTMISWQSSPNTSVVRRLDGYLDLRNSIAHGEQVKVRRVKVEQFRKFIEVFASKLDENITLLIHVDNLKIYMRRRDELKAIVERDPTAQE